MKKLLFVFFCLTGIVSAESYNSYRDYVSEFFSKEEEAYIQKWNYHSGELQNDVLGQTRYSSKEVVISDWFTRNGKVYYSNTDFLSTIIHETIHIVLYYRGNDTDADGHGAAFFNEAYRISRLFDGTSISMTTRDIVGGIYTAKLIQLHGKGIYTDEDRAEKAAVQPSNPAAFITSKPVAVTPSKPAVSSETESSSESPGEFISSDFTAFSLELAYATGHSGLCCFSNLEILYFILGAELEYTSSDMFSAGANLGLGLPLNFGPLKVIPDAKLDLSLNWQKSDFWVDVGGMLDVTIYVSFFSITAGIGFYKEKSQTFFIGGGIAFAE